MTPEYETRFVFLSKLKKGIYFSVISAVALQIIFFSSVPNAFGSCSILLSWVFTHDIIMKPENFLKYTFSSFIVFGFYVTQFYIPLVFTLLEGKPLVYNLKYPISVFLHSILAYGCLLIAFTLYKRQLNFPRKVLTVFLNKFEFFKVPTRSQIWIMGGLGALSLVASRIFFAGARTTGTEVLKFIVGLEPFSYLPFLLLFPSILADGGRKNNLKVSTTIIVVYILFLIVLGTMANTRGLFMRGITIIGLLFFLALVIGKINHRIIKLRNIVIASVGFWILTGPLSDLGTSMVMVRNLRTDISPKELLVETLEIYEDKDAVRQYKQSARTKVRDWDETYFDNIFLTRFSNLKYSDASLEQAFRMSNPDEEMQDVVYMKYLSVLPQPLLDIMGISLNKSYYGEASFGDFLYLRASGTGYGSFRTGNFMGMGLASFGWFYLVVLLMGAVLLFNFVDSLVLKEYRGIAGRYSVAGLLSVLLCFTYFGVSTPSESITTIFHYITRGWIQTIILYALLFGIARKLSRIL